MKNPAPAPSPPAASAGDTPTTTAILVAAGTSQRMGFDKLFHPINHRPVLLHSVRAFDAHPLVSNMVVVAGHNLQNVQALLAQHPPQKPCKVVRGGATRTASVAAGVAAATNATFIAIHDAARPFVSQAVITRTLQAAAQSGAAAPAVPMTDPVKRTENGFVAETLPRSQLAAVQTPQVFDRALFEAALAGIDPASYATYTDDCMVAEQAGLPVKLAEGDANNIKITTPADLPAGEGNVVQQALRVGHGYDVHRLVEGRPLILGGVTIPYEKGLQGHSDADVLLHAVADALLGAAALGDIGAHFPDNDPAYAGASSLALLRRVAALIQSEGYTVANVDATLLCQAPRLAGHIGAMRQNIAGALSVAPASVSVKATTEEGLGFTGRGQGIAAHCVALLHRHSGALAGNT